MAQGRRPRTRRAWDEMDHALLREELVYAKRVDERGPIPEFLAKKRSEQAPKTALSYTDTFIQFPRFCVSARRATCWSWC